MTVVHESVGAAGPGALPFPDVGLVVAAGGSSRRFGAAGNKLLRDLDGLPVVCHCLRTLGSVVLPRHIVLVVAAGSEDDFRLAVDRAGLSGEIRMTPGGTNRTESVWNGVCALPPACSLVAVQDAARPRTGVELLERCVASARLHGSGVAAHRVTDTIKVADPGGIVLSTPARDTLWAAETPQVFRRDWLEAACRTVLESGAEATDDAQAVEHLGHPVHLVESRLPNPKITYPHDLA